MNMRAIATKTVAAGVMALALTGVGAGMAEAKPRPGNCDTIYQGVLDSYSLADAAKAQGDTAGYNEWTSQARYGSRAWLRLGCDKL